MSDTPKLAPPRKLPARFSPLNPDGSLVISAAAIKALRMLVVGVNEDTSPTIRQVRQIMEESGCGEEDKDVILFILDLHAEF